MTAARVKAFLDSFCCEAIETYFTIAFSNRSTRQLRGKYLVGSRGIILYPHARKDHSRLERAALHELAHHLSWERHAAHFIALSDQGKRIPIHGREFTETYYGLLAALEWRHKDNPEPFPSVQTPEEKLMFAIFGKS